jgi:hypothetical protein
MATTTEICNLALSHLGNGKEISNLETDASDEGSVCRRFYETAKDATLRDFNWPFTTKFREMALIEEDPTSEWGFSYRYPTDCLKIRRILSGIRNDTNDSRAKYKIGRDDAGLLVYTDIESAEIEYTIRLDDPSQYPPDFILALSFRLAFYIAPRVTAGDPFNLQQKMMQMYQMEISNAAKTSVNEEQPDVEPDSEFQRSRT